MVDRTIHGPYENYQTPEQNIPSKQLDYPWESCITLTDDWGWVPRPRFKSPRRIINMLSEIVAKGGCLVLGVGPTPEGVIEPESVTRLEEIGTWLHHNGKAIYNTRTTKIYNSGNIWFTADKDGYTFYAIYALPEQNKLPDYIEWEGNIPAKNSKVRLLSDSRTLKWKVENNKVRIYLPKGLAEESFAISFQMQKDF
jgi:alpha-L-fucosidase